MGPLSLLVHPQWCFGTRVEFYKSSRYCLTLSLLRVVIVTCKFLSALSGAHNLLEIEVHDLQSSIVRLEEKAMVHNMFVSTVVTK